MSNAPPQFRMYFAAALTGAVMRDHQKKTSVDELIAEARNVALAAMIEEAARFPAHAPGAAPLALVPPPGPPAAAAAPQYTPVGQFAPLGHPAPVAGVHVPPPGAPHAPQAPAPGSTQAANGLFVPPAGSIPGWHGDPTAPPPPPPVPGAPVEKIAVTGAVNAPLRPDSLCPSCKGYRAAPSITGDITCSHMHYEPYGRLPPPAGVAPTMTTG